MVKLMIFIVGRHTHSRSRNCQIWYQRIMGTNTMEVGSMIEQDTQSPAPHPRKGKSNDDERPDDNPAHFRRVRLRCWNQVSSFERDSVKALTDTGFTRTFIDATLARSFFMDTLSPNLGRATYADFITTRRAIPRTLDQVAASFAEQFF